MSFSLRGLECKSWKSRETWSSRQIWLWSTEWNRSKANRVSTRECTSLSKTPSSNNTRDDSQFSSVQSLSRVWLFAIPWIAARQASLTWTSPHGQYWNQINYIFLQWMMEKLYTVSKIKTGSWLWLISWTPYCKFRLKLNKVGKTTRPFRYDLNQIPYKYTVEVTNRFKGLDLIDRVPEELWMEVCDCTGGIDQDHPQRKKSAKRQNGCLRRPYV